MRMAPNQYDKCSICNITLYVIYIFPGPSSIVAGTFVIFFTDGFFLREKKNLGAIRILRHTHHGLMFFASHFFSSDPS